MEESKEIVEGLVLELNPYDKIGEDYIENMPKHQIPEVDNYQVNRILAMTQNTKTLRGKSSSDTTTLLNEVNVDFA